MIDSWELGSYDLPVQRVFGDVHDRIESLPFGSLTLHATGGAEGVGFFWGPSYPQPSPSLAELERVFESESAPGLLGRVPSELIHRVSRPRSFAARRSVFADAIELALWDLYAKRQELPLYRVLGGYEGRVRAYASGLDYPLSTDEAQRFFAAAAAQGFTAFKVKVGRPTLDADLARLRAVAEAVGPGATIMIDANEAWSPKETLRRTNAFLEAGINLFWVEDPCIRDDLDALAALAHELPVHLCLGDYLDASAKVRAIEQRACDIVRLSNSVTDSMRLGWLAAEHGMPTVMPNSVLDHGVHLGAALPGVLFLECSFLGYEQIASTPVTFEDGHAVAPAGAGHGIVLDSEARERFAAITPA